MEISIHRAKLISKLLPFLRILFGVKTCALLLSAVITVQKLMKHV